VSRWYSRAVVRIDEMERLSEQVLERLSEIERGHALVSGQRVQPKQEPGAVTFNVELLEDRTEIVEGEERLGGEYENY
jgi:hypothetical protein